MLPLRKDYNLLKVWVMASISSSTLETGSAVSQRPWGLSGIPSADARLSGGTGACRGVMQLSADPVFGVSGKILIKEVSDCRSSRDCHKSAHLRFSSLAALSGGRCIIA